jgi:hypothetical protein
LAQTKALWLAEVMTGRFVCGMRGRDDVLQLSRDIVTRYHLLPSVLMEVPLVGHVEDGQERPKTLLAVSPFDTHRSKQQATLLWTCKVDWQEKIMNT